jgi:hypothetical protein
MGTSQHVDAVDLEESGVLQDATKMATIRCRDRASPGRTMTTEALCGDRETAGLGGAEIGLRWHGRIVSGCAHG